MLSRLIVLGILGFMAVWAVSGSRAGSGAERLWAVPGPAQAIARHEAYLQQEADRAARAELDRRYRAGELDAAERMEYEAMIERERQEQIERERVAAAAAAARAATIRNTRRTGGGPSGGK